VSPEQVRAYLPSPDGRAKPWRHGAGIGARAWYLGCLILEAGRGPRPALAVTAGGPAQLPGSAVTASTRLLLAH
jgi:hypothetical protein